MKTESGKNINRELALFFYDVNSVEYSEVDIYNVSNLLEVMKYNLPEYFEHFFELSVQDQLIIYEQSRFYTLDSTDNIIRFIKTRILLDGTRST